VGILVYNTIIQLLKYALQSCPRIIKQHSNPAINRYLPFVNCYVKSDFVKVCDGPLQCRTL
jgi:hypothetical protein